MPADNIKRSIQRGTGEIEGATFETVTYEGYGPAGVALMVECATDNRNRTVAAIRNIFGKHGGRLGESGSVSYRFRPIGLVTIARRATDEDTLFNIALEAGAEDVRSDDEHYAVVSQPEDFGAVRDAIETSGIAIASAEYTMEPTDTVQLDEKDAGTMLRLLDALEENEDVQSVHANFDIPDEVLEAAGR